MMRSKAPILLISLVISHTAVAAEYVPPPTGPYQSSSVITGTEVGNSQQQVYRFPSEELFERSEAPKDLPPLRIPRQSEQGPYSTMQETSPAEFGGMENALSPRIEAYPNSYVNPNAPAYNYPTPGYYGDPWSGNNAYYQQTGPGTGWATQQPYGYSTPYPYGSYPGTNPRYGYDNNPFSSMPSPWSVMPMQNFFSGNKKP